MITSETGTCQKIVLNPKEWAQRLSDPEDIRNEADSTLYQTLIKLDQVKVFNFLDKLNNKSANEDHYFGCLNSQNPDLFSERIQ